MIIDRRKDLRKTGNELRDYSLQFGGYSLDNPLNENKIKPNLLHIMVNIVVFSAFVAIITIEYLVATNG